MCLNGKCTPVSPNVRIERARCVCVVCVVWLCISIINRPRRLTVEHAERYVTPCSLLTVLLLRVLRVLRVLLLVLGVQGEEAAG